MRPRSTTLLAIVGFALAGCGGPDLNLGSGDFIGAPDGDYEEAASSICEQVAQRFEEAQANEPRTFEQGGQVVGTLLEVATTGESQLATLDPPDARGAAFERYLDARAEVVALLERAQDAAADEDGTAFEDARSEAEDGVNERAKLAKRAGLPACARAEGG